MYKFHLYIFWTERVPSSILSGWTDLFLSFTQSLTIFLLSSPSVARWYNAPLGDTFFNKPSILPGCQTETTRSQAACSNICIKGRGTNRNNLKSYPATRRSFNNTAVSWSSIRYRGDQVDRKLTWLGACRNKYSTDTLKIWSLTTESRFSTMFLSSKATSTNFIYE